MAWKKGPLPKDTFWYGGVVVHGDPGEGFHFADFQGDHVLIDLPNGKKRRVEAHEVKLYDNSLQTPTRAELE